MSKFFVLELFTQSSYWGFNNNNNNALYLWRALEILKDTLQAIKYENHSMDKIKQLERNHRIKTQSIIKLKWNRIAKLQKMCFKAGFRDRERLNVVNVVRERAPRTRGHLAESSNAQGGRARSNSKCEWVAMCRRSERDGGPRLWRNLWSYVK